jgi:hypothetical protein
MALRRWLRTKAPVLLVAALVAVAGLSSCGEEIQKVGATGISRFEAEVMFGPGSTESCEGKPCTRVTIIVRNVGQRTADTNCTIRLTGVPRSNTVVSPLFSSEIRPGQSVRWNVDKSIPRPNGYRAHCPAYDAGALSNVG